LLDKDKTEKGHM